MIKPDRAVITKFSRSRKFSLQAFLIFLLVVAQNQPAGACRFNVREVGFVDLQLEPYVLFGYVSNETGEDAVSRFKQMTDVSLEKSNIKFEIINTDRQKEHPAMKLLDLQLVRAEPAAAWQEKSPPAAVLVSPDGQSYPVNLAERDRPFEETLRSAIEDILSSPKRQEILQKAIENYAVILLIEGADAQENQKAKDAVSKVIELIRSQMDMMPKSISRPPVLVVMDPKSFKSEKILLWSLALTDEEINEPRAAVIYGRGRWIGPMFKGKEITEDNLANVLFIIGQDCECGLDHRWTQGTMLPAGWTDEMREQVAENLGFDPESPMIKMEMSMIVRMGSYSYHSVPAGAFGYQEFSVEPDEAVIGTQNSPNEVNYTTIPVAGPGAPMSEADASLEPDSLFHKMILLFAGLCFLVLASGLVILVRAKNR